MKKVILVSLMMVMAVCCYGQYSQVNSFMRKALVTYKMGNDGFYYKVTDEMVPVVDNVVSIYAYDAKAQNLYVQTNNSNCVVTLTKDYAKIVKKNKMIPHVKGDDVLQEIEKVNSLLDAKFEQLNGMRRQHIADSIAAARARAKADSIAAARADSIRMAKIEQKKSAYMAEHKWIWLPVGNTSLRCALCDEYISHDDSIFCAAIKNDTIYHVERKDLALGFSYLTVHKSAIPSSLKKDDKFMYHCEVYSDSLMADKHKVCEDTELMNWGWFNDALENMRKFAPNGYVVDWGWDNEYSNISFELEYMNTNKKTIKYINVFFKVTNAVGDVRKTGNFKGTGPVEEMHSASWDWDYSHYYVAGDASNMEITKIIITYMDGSQKVLTGNQIKYED